MRNLPELHLVDDGTMDTILVCQACRQELRYRIERDACGDIDHADIERMSEDHADECEGSPTANYLPTRYNGEWSE